MADDLDLFGLALQLHRTRDWTQRHWRRLVRDQGLPAPFVGAERGASPWWNGDLVARWKAGEGRQEGWQGSGRIAQPTSPSDDAPANDRTPPKLGPRAEQLLRSLA